MHIELLQQECRRSHSNSKDNQNHLSITPIPRRVGVNVLQRRFDWVWRATTKHHNPSTTCWFRSDRNRHRERDIPEPSSGRHGSAATGTCATCARPANLHRSSPLRYASGSLPLFKSQARCDACSRSDSSDNAAGAALAATCMSRSRHMATAIAAFFFWKVPRRPSFGEDPEAPTNGVNSSSTT